MSDARPRRALLALLMLLVQLASLQQLTRIPPEISAQLSLILPLERALTLAEPEGYVRIFVGEGEPMRDLLRHAAAGDIASSYARRLLSAFDKPVQPAPRRVKATSTGLAEPPTGREV